MSLIWKWYFALLIVLGALVRIRLSAPLKWEDLVGSDSCQKYLNTNGFINASYAFTQQRFEGNNSHNHTAFPSMILIGDSTLQNKRDWVVEILGHNETIPFMMRIGKKTCQWLQYAFNKMKSKPSAMAAELILWNHGLHTQHLLPAVGTGLKSLHEYEQQLHCMADAVVQAFPSKQIYYKLTNRVCHNKFTSRHLQAAFEWTNSPTKTMLPRYATQMTTVGTEFVNYIERRLPRKYNFTLVNNWVSDACECTELGDGRHYAALIPQFWNNFLQLVAKRKEKLKQLQQQ